MCLREKKNQKTIKINVIKRKKYICQILTEKKFYILKEKKVFFT